MQIGGADYRQLQRVLAGMAVHPNVGAYMLIGLGCEVNQIADLIDVILSLAEAKNSARPAEISRRSPHPPLGGGGALGNAAQNGTARTIPTFAIQASAGRAEQSRPASRPWRNCCHK
jgi:hypothetical protein